jgi:outer membrane receptor for ferric coprogen and ferric-rhodotorulic acid
VAASVAVVLGLTGTSIAGPAMAQTTSATRSYDIAAGPLGSALNQFGRATGAAISYDPAIVAGKTTRGLRGSHSPASAIAALLRGTGLQAQSDGSGGFVISLGRQVERRPVRQRATAPVATTEAPAETADIVVLGKSYGVEAGAKALAPLREVPNSLTIVDQQRIADQNLFNLDDVFRRTTNVATTNGNEYADFRSRGFIINNYLVDGVPYNGFTGEIPDLFVYDRVEILRGPAGLFSGSGSPAGSINLVRKRAGDELVVSALALAGSWNNFRGEIDASVPLAEGVKVRAGVAAQDRDMFYDVARQRRFTTFANADIDLGETTKLSFGGYLDRFRGKIFNGVPGLAGGGPADLPRTTYGGADFNRSRYRNQALFVELRQEVGDDWLIRASGQLGGSDTRDASAYTFAFFGITPTDGTADFMATSSHRNQDYVTADVNAVGTVSLFGREHQIVFGADIQRIEARDEYGPRVYLGSFDLYAPDYDAYPEPALAPTFITNTTTKQYGAYGQARLKLADPLTLVLGGRLSWYEQDVETLFPALPATQYRKKARFTPYAGIVYDVVPGWTAYANYAETFSPQSGLTISGEAPPPAIGKQYEAGVKTSPFGDKLLLSASLFQIEQTGIAQSDPLNPGFVIAAGKIRSRGVEFEVNGELSPGWTINGGYAYTHIRYINDTQNLAAANARQQPRHSVKLWTMYRPESGALERWSLGGGLTWQSRIEASLTQLGFAGAVYQNAYALVDMRLGYQITDEVELAVTVNNLFDKTYYEKVNGTQFGNFYGMPRQVLGTVRARF